MSGMAQDFLRRFFIVTGLLAVLALTSDLAVRFLGVPDFPGRAYVEFAIATAIFAFGLVFFEHAWHEIKAHAYGMMTLVSIAVGAGYVFSAVSTFVPALGIEFYLEIATLIWVLLFGHYLEAKSSNAAGDALAEVAKLLPQEARREDGTSVPVSELEPGVIVVVRAGEKVPADGTIKDGSASFNEAHLSGESKPVEKEPNDAVVAGAICLDGSVRVTLTKVGSDSTIGQIQELIGRAQTTKPSAQRLADRAARVLTFVSLTVAILTVLAWTLLFGQTFVFAITLAITVLVITCPHALGLAIPTVSTIATRMAVGRGIFLKDLGKLEVAQRADYVVFDKTGTLTTGVFGVSKIAAYHGSETDVLGLAASLEAESSHVIGASIVSYANDRGVRLEKVTRVKNLAGKGVEAAVGSRHIVVGSRALMEERGLLDETSQRASSEFEGMTVAYVADEKRVLGAIGLADDPRPESRDAIDRLHAIGVKVAMLTGDSEQAAQRVAREIGIDTVFAEVLPEDKYEHIRKLQEQGHVVLMTGDGVNDAPALTQADVGVAIGAGTDVAVEAGDIVLTKSDPRAVASLVVLSRKVYAKMIQNLWWALGYNVVAIPLAAGVLVPIGFRLSPAVGAFVMSLSSVIVVANAMTLRRAQIA